MRSRGFKEGKRWNKLMVPSTLLITAATSFAAAAPAAHSGQAKKDLRDHRAA